VAIERASAARMRRNYGFGKLPVKRRIISTRKNGIATSAAAWAKPSMPQARWMLATLSDRGTWLSFDDKGSLVVAIEGDPRLINRYDVIELSPQKHAAAKPVIAKVSFTAETTRNDKTR
jgi:ABC-type tungstate transport system permease subunit